MQRPDQPPRYIPNAIIYKGYVVQLAQRGVGKSWEEGGITAGGDGDTWTVWERYEEVMKPYFDGAKVTDGVKEPLRKLETVEQVFAAGMGRYLLKFGAQDGYIITNQDEEKAEKQRQHDQAVAEKQLPVPVTSGYFGLRIGERLPATDWQKIKHLAEYHKGDESDMEWLDDHGHLAREAGPCSKPDAEAASNLQRVKVLDMQGPDIYGGGAWLHVDGDDLFYVRNNGMDGDDWSRNNYPTGGAGAICYRIPGSAHLVAEIRTWVESLGKYAIYAEE